ncbi:MAG: hypothetical protein ACRD38_08295, partial [Nitrososphaerales archaeon]
KSIFFCDLDNDDNTGSTDSHPNSGSEKKVDQVIFTEIWEDLELLPNDPVVKKEFLAFTCVVVLAEDGDEDPDGVGNDPDDEPEDFPARVESCRSQSG